MMLNSVIFIILIHIDFLLFAFSFLTKHYQFHYHTSLYSLSNRSINSGTDKSSGITASAPDKT